MESQDYVFSSKACVLLEMPPTLLCILWERLVGTRIAVGERQGETWCVHRGVAQAR